MDERYLGYNFGGLGQKICSGEGSAAATSMSYDDVATVCENSSSAVVEGTAKKKRESRIIGGGLRQFSIIVCKKLESKGRSTYGEVADEIIADFSGTHSDTATSLDESDEKNIRRRVYDALNVLMALDIIVKDKKEILWKGLPNTNMKDLEEIKAFHVKMMTRIGKKVAYLKDLEEQIAGLQDLMTRNQQLLKCGNASPEGFSLPFILVQTSPHATVEIEISEDMQLVHLDLNSTPFSLHDDAYILKLMRYYQQPESQDVSRSSPIHSSSNSSIASRGIKPFHWNSESHSLE